MARSETRSGTGPQARSAASSRAGAHARPAAGTAAATDAATDVPTDAWTRARSDPAARYGRRPGTRRRRLVLALGVVAVAAALVVLAVTARGYADRDARWRTVAYEVVGPDRVDLTYEVSGDAGTRLRCVLRATEPGGADVGQVEQDLPALGDGWRRASVMIETLRRADGASVRTCVVLP